jgi:SP family sugar:H+ symporter-like MFS transporter
MSEKMGTIDNGPPPDAHKIVWASVRSVSLLSTYCTSHLLIIFPVQALFAAFAGILCGYDIGLISGVQAMPNWLCTFGKPNPAIPGVCMITSPQQSLAVATLPIGGTFGSLFAGPTADFLGRRWSVVIGLLVFAAGVSMQIAATALPLFWAGRVFTGFGVGMSTTLIIVYQSECSPKWIR